VLGLLVEDQEMRIKYAGILSLLIASPWFDRTLGQEGNTATLQSPKIVLTQATDETIRSLPLTKELEEISLDRCAITDESLRILAASSTIKRLRIPRTKVTDRGVAELARMSQLELLDLTDCLITSEGIGRLQSLPKLKNLSLSGVGDREVEKIGQLPTLAALSLQNVSITEGGYRPLSNLKRLKEFSLIKAASADGALVALADAKELAKLRIKSTKIRSETWETVKDGFRNVLSLDLGETTTDDQAIAWISPFPKLEDLNLLRTPITRVGIQSLSAKRLKKLNVDDCSGVDDSAVDEIAKIKSLEFLHVGKTKITDAGLAKLTRLESLKDLILNDTQVSDEAIRKLQQSLPMVKIKR